MSFQSIAFAAFLTVVLLVYRAVPERLRRYVLLAASYVFYATWSLPHTALLAGLTVACHRVGLALEGDRSERAKGRLVGATLAGLVAVLALFKYATPVLAWLGVVASSRGAGVTPLELVAPLGISYYVFKLISYVLDVHWGKLRAERDLVDLASYVAFFPQILSGPIQRAGDFLGQDAGRRAPRLDRVQSGLRLILFGFFQKFVVADRLGIGVDAAFADPRAAEPGQLLAAIYVFPWQLYADFSGLTDIAIGLGRLFDVEAPENFRAPLYAKDIVDFWRRWHITLTSWVTAYVFTPLNLRLRNWGQAGLATAIVVNMLAVAMWHGARWTFVVFGLINGVVLVVATLTSKARNKFFSRRPQLARLRLVTGPLLTFHFVAYVCILFRAPTLGAARDVLVRALPAYLHPAQIVAGARISWKGASQLALALAALVLMELVHLARRRKLLPTWLYARPAWIRWPVYYSALLAVVLLGVYSTKTFIYVQF